MVTKAFSQTSVKFFPMSNLASANSLPAHEKCSKMNGKFTALRDSFVLSYIVCTHYPYIRTESTDSMMQYWKSCVHYFLIKSVNTNDVTLTLHVNNSIMIGHTLCNHNLPEQMLFIYKPQACRKHFLSGTATGEGSVGSGDPSARSAEKFFTFIFQLSGLALVAPLCFALPRPYLAMGQGGNCPPDSETGFRV